MTIGNNVMPALKTKDIEKEHARITNLRPKSISKISTIIAPAEYKSLNLPHPWGNTWEVAQYNY
jgi:hypothetical protein